MNNALLLFSSPSLGAKYEFQHIENVLLEAKPPRVT